MTYTYCMTSHCDLAGSCARHEDDAARHLLHRTYADFSEELVRQPDSTTTCPFYLDKRIQAEPDAGVSESH
ncbi:MAG: hypothetical protein AB1593_08825 [Pseudomonadota bacterium]